MAFLVQIIPKLRMGVRAPILVNIDYEDLILFRHRESG
jgi:hypothetical protein